MPLYNIPLQKKDNQWNIINEHPILTIPIRKEVSFFFNGKELLGIRGIAISSSLYMNGIKIFGHHEKDNSPQGIFCANGQCAQCTVIVNGKVCKACITYLEEGMVIQSCEGTPELERENIFKDFIDIPIIDIKTLIIGAGPAGLAACKICGENGIEVLLIDDKDRLGGKLILQTHKFFGSQAEVYAGVRGFNIGKLLTDSINKLSNVEIWLNSPAIAVFSDGYVGVLKDMNSYILIKPEYLFIATGAREKMLSFSGNTLPGVYGSGAFQTILNRDLIIPANRVFIIGGGNVGLIVGYHAIQAGIDVGGIVELLPECSGYKVHEDKLRWLEVPIYTNHKIISANGNNKVESITLAKVDKKGEFIPNSEKTFKCDAILIAVGLNPVNEIYNKAKEFGFNVIVAGDAKEIAEASAAIYSGKIQALKMIKGMGNEIKEDIFKLSELVDVLKQKSAIIVEKNDLNVNEGIFPVFHCYQEIPCNPCTTICPQNQIATHNDSILKLPYFKKTKNCTGCGKCVAICPGLSINLIDYREDKNYPIVTFPFELEDKSLTLGGEVIVMNETNRLGEFKIKHVKRLKKFPHTQLVSVKLPVEIAQKSIGIKSINSKRKDISINKKKDLKINEEIICRCERITKEEIITWIKEGIKDFNELKALTKVGMGSCGGKTCIPLIYEIFLEEGIKKEEITPASNRPLFMEVPLGIFAGINDQKDREL